VFFRVRQTARELWLRREQHPIVIPLGGAHLIEVILEPPTEEQTQAGYHERHAFVTASSRFNPSDRIVGMFTNLRDNQLPQSWAEATRWPWSDHMNPDGSFSEGFVPPIEAMPEAFREFHRQAVGELRDAARRTVLALRWRKAQRGPHSPTAGVSEEWSLDGATFRPMPNSIAVLGESFGPLGMSPEELQQVGVIVQDGGSEPLGHSLWREAWEQRHSNPRSALVIGLAAAEVGAKECVSDLVPATSWLMDNMPSPPLVSLLREYLPRLPQRLGINGASVRPPGDILEILRNAVSRRNTTVHAGAGPLGSERLEQFLFAVRDVLWLLDYCRGHAWALDHVRAETRDALENVEGG
jgi:hypothetical protein